MRYMYVHIYIHMCLYICIYTYMDTTNPKRASLRPALVWDNEKDTRCNLAEVG